MSESARASSSSGCGLRARRGRALAPLAVAAAAAALACPGGMGGPAAPRAAVLAGSCPPVSAAQLHSILGLPHSLVERNDVADAYGALDYVCYGAAWTGAMPTSLQASAQKARRGQGAQFGIESWQPSDGSPDLAQWESDGYDKLTGNLQIGVVAFAGLLSTKGQPTHRILPFPGLGYDAVGLKLAARAGPANGLVVALGCWWNDSAHSAACIAVEEAPGKPVVKHLSQLAKIAVPKMLG